MKPYLSFIVLSGIFAAAAVAEEAFDPKEAANTVVLDESGVKNLRLETVMVEERDFESTIFAIGRVEEIPGNQYSISSRIPGRAIEVNAFAGDHVKKGQVLFRVESRQPGDPPPIIELTAPHDGIVTESHVLKGQPIEPNNDLLDISDRSEMWVVARIPEQRAAGITPGTLARIRFPALGGEPITAELLRFGVKADREAGAIEGIFRVPNSDNRLQPGMRAEFDIIASKRPNVLAVPEEAVQGDPASRVVYTKHFELPNAFVKAPVVVGETGGGWIEIKQGLFPGDEVVTQGSYMLGFTGGGGGGSLREALDAAHGHKHAEDGSELKPEEQAGEEEAHAHSEGGSGGGAPKWLIYYAGGITVLLIVFAQLWWNLKRKGGAHHA
ncbi:MAG: efflux RND transporter periplasmic adaptor subunit [Verrucomicrobiae bacterium]|nr:efflux RND transporter periplasmic adaptor subunit [Verrucomicrobiae bacterium]